MAFTKNCAIFAFVFLLMLSIAYAASFDVSSEPIKDRIIINEVAKFNVTVRNNLDKDDEYRIYTLDFPTWGIRTEPISNPITIDLKPGEQGSVEIIVEPLKIKEIGAYQVNVIARSRNTDIALPVPVKVTILSTDTLIQGYVPTVLTSLGIPDKIDPRKDIPIKIVLNNQNIIDYSDLTIMLESNLVKDTLHTQLGPKEEKTIELTKKLDDMTPPQEDRLSVAIFKDKRQIVSPIVNDFSITEYSIQQDTPKEQSFLKIKSGVKVISNNPAYNGVIKVETNQDRKSTRLNSSHGTSSRMPSSA